MILPSKAVNTLPKQGVFFLLGVSGSGKGTLAKALLQENLIAKHLSMGDLLRQRLTDASLETFLSGEIPIGFSSRVAFLQHAVQSGLLIPDVWTQSIVEHELKQHDYSGLWVFDGYPRSPAAAQHLLSALKAHSIPCLGVIHLELEYAVMQRRLLARGRADDTLEAIANRYQFYCQSVVPTMTFLEQHVPVLKLDATLEPSCWVHDVTAWLSRP